MFGNKDFIWKFGINFEFSNNKIQFQIQWLANIRILNFGMENSICCLENIEISLTVCQNYPHSQSQNFSTPLKKDKERKAWDIVLKLYVIYTFIYHTKLKNEWQ